MARTIIELLQHIYHDAVASLNERSTRLALVFIALVMLVALCGCTPPPDHPPPPTVLVATASSAEQLPQLPTSVEAQLVADASKAKKPGDAMVHIIASADGPVISRDLTPLRGKDIEHAPAARERKIHDNIAALKTDLAAVVAQAPGLDLLPLLDRASQYPHARIYALSSGATTKAPVDLVSLTANGWNFDPVAVAESVHRQGLLNLTGHHVTFAGLGVTGGSVQPRIPAYGRKVLADLWIRICQDAGATSCSLVDGDPSAAPPRATLPVPVVPVPPSITETGTGCILWQRFSDSDQALHFAANSAELPASADDVLRPLVESVRRCNVRQVAIVGHIAATPDATGDGGDSSNLSGRRAKAVAARLVSLGLPSELLGTVTGRGASEPVIPNLSPSGAFIESAAAQNRRVEVTLQR